MRVPLALTNSAIILMASVLVALVMLPLRSYVTLRAIDEQLSRIASSAPPTTDPFSARPIFIQTDAENGVILTRSANMGSAQLPLAQRGFSDVMVDGHRLRI